MSRHEAGGTLPPPLTSRNGDPAHTTGSSIAAAQGLTGEAAARMVMEHDAAVARVLDKRSQEAIDRATSFATHGGAAGTVGMSYHSVAGRTPPVLTAAAGDNLLVPGELPMDKPYHSVAGQPAAALLQAQLEGREPWTVRTEPLTLLDFIDARVREIDAERLRLSMLREQVTSAGLFISVDDIRRVLG